MFTSIPAGYMNQYTLVHRHQCISLVTLVEGSLEVKLPTIWTVEKQR